MVQGILTGLGMHGITGDVGVDCSLNTETGCEGQLAACCTNNSFVSNGVFGLLTNTVY